MYTGNEATEWQRNLYQLYFRQGTNIQNFQRIVIVEIKCPRNQTAKWNMGQWIDWTVFKIWNTTSLYMFFFNVFNIPRHQIMQMKTTLRYQLITHRMTVIKKSDKKCRRGCIERGTLMHCWWSGKLIQTLWKSDWWFLKKKNRTTLWTSYFTSGYIPKELYILHRDI